MAVMGAESTPIAAARAIMRNVDRIVPIRGVASRCARAKLARRRARPNLRNVLVPENNTLRQIAPVGCDEAAAITRGENELERSRGQTKMSDIPIWEYSDLRVQPVTYN